MDQCQSNHKRVNGVMYLYHFCRLLKVRRKNVKTSLTLFEEHGWFFLEMENNAEYKKWRSCRL